MTLITCPDCRQPVSDLAPACPHCGRPGGISTPSPTGPAPDCSHCEGARQSGDASCATCGRRIHYEVIPKNIQHLIAWTLIAQDDGTLWDAEAVSDARDHLANACGGVPIIESLYATYGRAQVSAFVNDHTSKRRQALEEAAAFRINNQCHNCGSSANVERYSFALATPSVTKRQWGMTAASIALSAVTLPLFGMGRWMGASKSKMARVVRLELVLCEECRAKRVADGDADLASRCFPMHPHWGRLREMGFTEFLTAEEAARWQPVRE